MERSQHVRHLTDALATLLNAPDLNLDELEPETIAAIEQARETFAMVRDGFKRFRVRYARIVLMETDVHGLSTRQNKQARSFIERLTRRILSTRQRPRQVR